MGAITGTLAVSTPLAGKRFITVTATLASASDVITLTLADHGVRTIYFAQAVMESGADAECMAGLQTSFSGLAVTVVSQVAAGTASTAWGNTIRLLILVD